MPDARIEKIFVAADKAGPASAVDAVHAIAGGGLEGDRYCVDPPPAATATRATSR